MALKLFRRHRKECEAGHPEDLRTGQFEEGRRGWKRCACLIHATGTLDGKFSRKQTGRSIWDEAKAVASIWETAGSWDGPKPEPPQPILPEAIGKQRTTILDATEAFMAHRQNRGVAPATIKKYKTFTTQLKAFGESRGYIYLDQLTVSDMDRFFASWKGNIRSNGKKLERLKGFVHFCIRRKWITEDIADDLQAPEGASIPVQKIPFTDAELDRIYAACDAIGEPPKAGPGYRNWTGADVKDFIDLSLYTGLRISDVATFDITKRLTGNDVFLRMHKTKKPLYSWIPDELVCRLRERQKIHGPLIFKCGVTFNMRQLTEIWRGKRLAKVFRMAGPFEEKATPHRLRHTFVRILLQRGVRVEDVADLIGDKEEILRKFYAPWVTERQERLSGILRDAFTKKSKPKLVEMPKLG